MPLRPVLHPRLCEGETGFDNVLNPTATLLEHALLAQGFMGVSKVAFPRCLQLQNRDSTGANLSNAIKCRCRDKIGESLWRFSLALDRTISNCVPSTSNVG